MKQDISNGLGLVDRGPRKETTTDMSAGRLLKYDPGSAVPRRQLTNEERAWLITNTHTDTDVSEGAS